MASQARTPKPKPAEGVTDRLAFASEQLLECVPDPFGCRACADLPCVLHRRAKAVREVLKELGR